MNVPLIQQGIDQLFGKGRLTLEFRKKEKLHWYLLPID